MSTLFQVNIRFRRMNHNIDILVPNQYVPELIKYVWVEVEWDWGTPDYPIDVYLYAGINDPSGGDVVIEPYPGSPKQNVAGDGWTYCWTIDPQPDWEQIHFTSDDYRLLENGVERVEVGTYCIPEPASLTIWSLTGLAFAAVLWRHRKSSLSN